MTTTLAPKNKGKIADTKHVDQLIRQYKKERWFPNSQRLGKADSLSAWYGLDELSQFLELARKNNADGIKMYFGVYPPDFAETPEFQGRQTIVLVATKEKKNEAGSVNKDIYVKRDGKLEILAFNFSTLCPPFCGTGLPPDGDGEYGIDMEKIGVTIIQDGNNLIIA